MLVRIFRLLFVLPSCIVCLTSVSSSSTSPGEQGQLGRRAPLHQPLLQQGRGRAHNDGVHDQPVSDKAGEKIKGLLPKLGLRVVCISDTHGCHADLGELPAGDILVHAGDFTKCGRRSDLVSFKCWLDRQMLSREDAGRRFQHCVVVNGNHENNAMWKSETKRLLERGEGLAWGEGKDTAAEESWEGALQAELRRRRERQRKTKEEVLGEGPQGGHQRGGGPSSVRAAISVEEDGGDSDSKTPPALPPRALENAEKTVGKISFLLDEFLELRLQVQNENNKNVPLRIFGTQFYWPMARYHETFFTRFCRFLTAFTLADRFDANPNYDLIPRPAPVSKQFSARQSISALLTCSCRKRHQQKQNWLRYYANLKQKSVELDDFWHANSFSAPHYSDDGVDLLISHEPCRGWVDGERGKPMGCGDLARVVKEVTPRAVIGGHIHHAHGVVEDSEGVVYVNAAICGSEGYRKGWDCVVVDI